MIRAILCGALAAAVAYGTAASQAEEIGTEIDLTTFGESAWESASVWEGVPLQEVARSFGTTQRRFYVSAMIGPSFANEWSPDVADIASQGSLFNAGGALGISFERARGRLRLELEGMGRSTYVGEEFSYPGNDTILTNNWSTMVNVWRDLMLTDRFGIYGGGGLGEGGYVVSDRFADGSVDNYGAGNAFAWQFGVGLLWEVTDRLTFDTGYRYFRIDTINLGPILYPSEFGSSELMFTLRLYEPFRGWRR